MIETAPVVLSRVPPDMRHLVSGRGDWTLCAMEHTRIGAIRFDDPGAPFHHLSLPLGGDLPRMGMQVDGRRYLAGWGRDTIGVIEAHAGGTTWWDGPFESACFYFTPQALATALGREVDDAHAIRTTATRESPVIARLLRALHADAEAGQPHGTLVGDAIFTALAAQLVPGARTGAGARGADWRVRRALEYIHAHLAERLSIPAIAAAAATSPFHLSRAFRAALGWSIWRYVLRERARLAVTLMRDASLTLADVAQRSGFDTYAGFIAAVKREFGAAPAKLRAAGR